MTEIRRYVIVDAQGREGVLEYPTRAEAVAIAKMTGGIAVFARIYELTGEYTVWEKPRPEGRITHQECGCPIGQACAQHRSAFGEPSVNADGEYAPRDYEPSSGVSD